MGAAGSPWQGGTCTSLDPQVLLDALFAFDYSSLTRRYGGEGSLNSLSLTSDAFKVENEMAETRIFPGKLDI